MSGRCECGSTEGPFYAGSGFTLICAECYGTGQEGYGPCVDIVSGVYTICRDITCANCYPAPCFECGAPDDEGCVCIPDIPLATWKAAAAALGVSLPPDATGTGIYDYREEWRA